MGASADLVGFVSLKAVQGKFVFLGPNCDSFDVQFIGCSKYPDGYF
jgi:hypothetical protein